MDTQTKQAVDTSPDQIIYANLLLIGVWAGIFILVSTYLIYISGMLPIHVDKSFISMAWDRSVNEYCKITHSPHGWGWVSLLAKGDFLNYIGLALLGLMTVICYMVLFRGYIRQKNWIFSAITFLEILVLSLAASGILGTGGH